MFNIARFDHFMPENTKIRLDQYVTNNSGFFLLSLLANMEAFNEMLGNQKVCVRHDPR